MKRNDIASFFYYMWNTWNKQECQIVFAQSNCGWQHIWNKWCSYCHNHIQYGATEEFFANLSDVNQDLLVKRALELYNRKRKINETDL